MFGRISYTWNLMGASWAVLKQDTRLLVFPLLSGVCCLLVLATFAVPMWFTQSWQPPGSDSGAAQQVAYYGVLFLFYLANYFVITFFNTAIVACAMLRMQGGEASVANGFREAAARLPQIAGWAMLAATIGLILRIIEDRSEKVGRIVAGLLGMAWSVVSFLVVPVLVVERKGPVEALKSSTALLKRTWGEQLIGNFSFGLVFSFLIIPGVGLVVIGFLTQSAVGLFVCIALAVVYFIALALIQSALQSIFQAAVYLYTQNLAGPAGFDTELLATALRSK